MTFRTHHGTEIEQNSSTSHVTAETNGSERSAGNKIPLATRILLVAPSLDIVGGHSVQAKSLLDLMKLKSDVTIDFLPFNPRFPRAISFLRRVKYVRTLLSFLFFLCSLVFRAAFYDAIHVFSAANYSFLLSAAPVIFVGRLFKTKTIINYHDGRASEHLSRWRSSHLMRFADRIVVPSPYLVHVFAEFGYQALSIPNVIEIGKFHFRLRDRLRPRFLHNRGLEELYDVPCTIRAFARVQQSYPNAELTIAHDGPLRAKLEKMVADLKLRHVKFIGKILPDDIAAMYDAADIFLTSPRIDNMPLSILESYASGLPVIATRAGGIPYIASDEHTALLVNPGEDEAMAEAALRLLKDADLVQRLTLSARAHCEAYSAESVVGRWMQLYGELASGASA